MPRQHKLMQRPPAGRTLLGLLGVVYVIYLVVFGRFVYSWMTGTSPSDPIGIHAVDTNFDAAVSYWTVANMSSAINADEQINYSADFTQASNDPNAGKAARQDGQAPSDSNLDYPVSTVGKIFFTNASGQNMVCSGTAVASLNHNVVDTAGHCLYWNGDWVHNVIFCPLYDSGKTPYGCWAARDLEVPSEWINARSGDLHRDFGMAIVSPNNEGNLTDVVGGAGWAYNQPTNSQFYAYGYPAGTPF